MVSWEKIHKRGKWKPTFASKTVTDFIKLLKKNKKKLILDHGCGSGRFVLELAKKGFFVVGLDFSPSALKLASLILSAKHIDNACLVLGNMVDLPFQDSTFDGILSNRVIEHATKADMKKAVSEIYRVLKPGGLALVTTKSTKDPKFGKGKKIEKETYEETKGMIHHFIDRKEAIKLFSRFKTLRLEEIEIIAESKKFRGKKYVYWAALLKK